MPAYCTLTDLEERFGAAQVTRELDRDGSGAVDANAADRAIADAAAEIDAYLAGRYALPLAAAPARVIALACDIAWFRAHAGTPPDDVRRRYEAAVAFLRDVAAGRAVIDAPSSAVEGTASGGIRHAAPERVFSRDALVGF